MSWLQLDFEATPENANALEALLDSCGAVSVTMMDAKDQPVYEPGRGETPLWESVIVTGLFPAENHPESIIMNLAQEFLPRNLPKFSSTILEEQDWQRAWMDTFAPISCGKRLWICPSWCEAPDPEAVNLLLDPGLAFGTGTHPTTSLCLEWLDQNELQGQHLIDFGCGSGILGLAALLLGANQVIGVDNDPQALLATADNAEKNSINPQQFPCCLPDKFPSLMSQNKADGVMANILAEPLISLAGLLADSCKPGGWIVLSGILEKQSNMIIEAYSAWFAVDTPVCKDGWVRISGTRL